MYNKPISVTLVIVLMSLSQMLSVQGQRPSFAGSRPANGGNQKDKYHTPQTQSADIANRFGGVEATPVQQLPFGAVQRPPMGVPIVVPHNTYLPLGGEVQPQILVNNRIGGTDDELLATNTPLAAAAPTQTLSGILRPSSTAATATTLSSSNPSTTTTQRLPLPLDAHGDYDLINQLSQVPEDHRPFWFLNYQAIEAHRNGSGSNGAFGASAQRGSFLG